MRKAVLGLVAVFALSPVLAADITLKLASFRNGKHAYYHRLLAESLAAAGHTVRIESEDDLPQPRVAKYLETGQLTLYWFLQTTERDAQYVRVDHKLTNGLIGQRVLLIPKGDEPQYAKVASLQDMQASGKVAGLGALWFDVDVWRENGLPVLEQRGEWRQLLPMMAARGRGIDYIPRGVTEVMAEAKDNPQLVIEPRLLFVYSRDFVFYLSRPNIALKTIVESALKQAEKSGLQRRLVEEYFGPSVAALDLDKRIRINLRNPTAN